MRTFPALLRGAAAGLVAGLVLTTVQATARLLIGVAAPAELIGDRIAPLLTIDQFFGLFGLFGGYHGLKQAGILGGTSAQLLLGVAVGATVGLLARTSVRQGLRTLAAVAVLGWVVLNAALWPILATNFVGFPSGPARTITLATTAVSVAAFALALVAALWAVGGLAGPQAGPSAPTIPVPARRRPTRPGRRPDPGGRCWSQVPEWSAPQWSVSVWPRRPVPWAARCTGARRSPTTAGPTWARTCCRSRRTTASTR